VQTADSKAVAGKFSCAACGRQFAWKPALAGKKAKCACGEPLLIPQSPPGPAAPVEDDAYDVAGAPPAPAPATRVATPVVAERSTAAPKWGAGGKVLVTVGAADDDGPDPREERRRRRAEAPLHRARDLYVPGALLIFAVVGILAWALSDAAPAGAAGAGITVGFVVAVKTAIMVGLALITAPALRVNFRDPRTPILKFAAVLLFADAALLWLDAAMRPADGAEPSASATARVLVVELLAAAVIVGVLSKFLFDLDAREVTLFAAPLGALSHVLGFMATLVVGAISVAYVEAAAEAEAYDEEADDAPAAVEPAAVEPGEAFDSETGEPSEELVEQPIELKETAEDRLIARRVRTGPVAREAREWVNELTTDDPIRTGLVDAFYRAGARKVYFDLSTGVPRPTKMYVELSRWPSERAACLAAYRTHVSPQVPQDVGQRYLVVEIKK
jgi:hypothetical protein